jgi:hypothetical protein
MFSVMIMMHTELGSALLQIDLLFPDDAELCLWLSIQMVCSGWLETEEYPACTRTSFIRINQFLLKLPKNVNTMQSK